MPNAKSGKPTPKTPDVWRFKYSYGGSNDTQFSTSATKPENTRIPHKTREMTYAPRDYYLYDCMCVFAYLPHLTIRQLKGRMLFIKPVEKRRPCFVYKV